MSKTIKIKVKLLNKNAIIPKKASEGSSGYDIYACEDVSITSGKVALVHTGISVEIPKGFEIQIRPRSGLALKKQITVLNTPGTIDSDYRGEIGVILINHNDIPVFINKGDRIAQMVINEVFDSDFIAVNNLEESKRGDGGFGSTGNQ